MPRGSRRRVGLEGLRCPLHPRCTGIFRSEAGRTNHVRSMHQQHERYQVSTQADLPDVPGSMPASPEPMQMAEDCDEDGPPRRSSSPRHQPEPPQSTNRGQRIHHPFINGQSHTILLPISAI